MTRLPELERQLFEAARALDAKPRRWRRISLLGGGAMLALAATAAGAAQLLLPEGDPVPKAPGAQRASLPSMDPGASRLSSVRARDPEGGLSWGLAITRSADGKTFCAQTGRVQEGRLGVIGRDGTFGDDGRFHPLAIDANQGGVCGGIAPDGDLRLSTDSPPIPASGFTGSFPARPGAAANASQTPTRRWSLRPAASFETCPFAKQAACATSSTDSPAETRSRSSTVTSRFDPIRTRAAPISSFSGRSRGSGLCTSPTGTAHARRLPMFPGNDNVEFAGPPGAGTRLHGAAPRADTGGTLACHGRVAAPSVGPLGAREVRVDSVRLLRRRADSVTILVSIGRLGHAPRVIDDTLCVLSEHKGRAPEISGCGTLEDVLRGRVRTTLPPAGLVPDGARSVQVRVTGGRTIDAPVHDNYYDLERPDGEQYTGIAPPRLIDEHGREFRPTIDQFAG